MGINVRPLMHGRVAAGTAAGVMSFACLMSVSPPAHAIPEWQVEVTCAGDVYLPGQPGDVYTFNLDAACRTGGVPYVFNATPDGSGWVTGMGFLGIPSNIGSSYNSHTSTWTYGFPTPDPADWYAAAIVGAPTFALMPLQGIELQSVNYLSSAIGGVGTAVGAVESGDGAFFTIFWGAPPTPADATGAPTFTLTSNPDDRGTCWPAVSGSGGTWVKLTDSGCTPPQAGATLLGWATSPLFPVAEARKVVDNGWTAYDGPVDGVRMVFIPINGYTALTGDQTLYPIWSS